MSNKTHVIVTLSKRGWGEAEIGKRIAQQLLSRGENVSFVIHERNAKLFDGAAFPYVRCSESFPSDLKYKIRRSLAGSRDGRLILCDLYTTGIFFKNHALDPKLLWSFDVPVVGVDTWDIPSTGRTIDLFKDKEVHIEQWVQDVPRTLIPVPMAKRDPKRAQFCNLPDPVMISQDSRSRIRSSLGLKSSDKLILFCTASWQQAPYPSVDVKRIGEAVPRLISHYANTVDKELHLIHVGPQELPLVESLGKRYHWIPQLRVEEFDVLLGSVDVLLSLNISATTVSKAIVSGVPNLVLLNSVRANDDSSSLPALHGGLSPFLREWLSEVTPLYPFALWPIGWRSFLDPLLQDNSYCSAVNVTELLDEKAVVGKLRDLLFSAVSRDECLQRQHTYVEQLRTLRNCAELIA